MDTKIYRLPHVLLFSILAIVSVGNSYRRLRLHQVGDQRHGRGEQHGIAPLHRLTSEGNSDAPFPEHSFCFSCPQAKRIKQVRREIFFSPELKG